MLGSSEGLGATTGLFAVEDRTHKIFSRKSGSARKAGALSFDPQLERKEYGPIRVAGKQPDSAWNYAENCTEEEFDRAAADGIRPGDNVFANEEMEIIHTRGNVNRYLSNSPRPGQLQQCL